MDPIKIAHRVLSHPVGMIYLGLPLLTLGVMGVFTVIIIDDKLREMGWDNHRRIL
jgi:hypothetical protein